MIPIDAALHRVRADEAKAAHIDEKFDHADGELVWRQEGPHHFVASVPGGAYVLRRADSRSRVLGQRYRWKALWVPQDSPDIKELALEKRKEWSQGAAESHYRRNR